MCADLRGATPTRGPFVVPRDTANIWTANGEVLVAECKSPHLSAAGNAANAHLLALGDQAIEYLRIALQQLAELGVENPEAQAIVDKIDSIHIPQRVAA
ncbi:hypothetical protein ABWU93_11615 [Xanthomonas translucens pv. translucens]|uniref:hypothetical protein n=1 Tax=Xanthomonas campestris pv. translucens TaxID=343 RepID=UPI003F6F66C1